MITIKTYIARSSYRVPILDRLLPHTEQIAKEYVGSALVKGLSFKDLCFRWHTSQNVIGAILALEQAPVRQAGYRRPYNAHPWRPAGECEGQRRHCAEMQRACVYRPEEGHCPACRDRCRVESVVSGASSGWMCEVVGAGR